MIRNEGQEKVLDLNELARLRYELEGKLMDSATQKLFKEKGVIQRKRRELNHREAAIDTVLEILGVRPNMQEAMGFVLATQLETAYAADLPFKGKTIPEACLAVVNDYGGLALDKRQVEYCLAIGGYQFDAKDPTNSVEIALRKLATDGKCDVIKGSGVQMSRYRSHAGVPSGSAFDIQACKIGHTDDLDDSDSRTTK
jgi:hypothetical protein